MKTATSTSGKNLGIAALVIGIVTVMWSLNPVSGAGALWPSLLGLALGMVALAFSLHGQNSKRGIIIAGFVLCMVSTGMSAYWNFLINHAAETLNSMNFK